MEERAKSTSMAKKLVHDLEERIRGVNAREEGMSAALTKVMAAEEAMAEALRCPACKETLSEPRTCTPCGHTYCAKCLQAEMGGSGENKYLLAVCPQCDGPAGRVLNVKQLGALSGPFAHQHQTLAELQLPAQLGSKTVAAASRLAGAARARVQARVS